MGGKSGGSNSTTTTETNNIDNRTVVGEGGGAIVGNSGTTVNITDGGAVREAVGLGKVVIEGQNKTFADALGFLNKGLEFVKDQRAGYDTQVQNLTKSYDGLLNAKQTAEVAPQAELMKVAGLVLVGVIAVNAFKKG